MLIKDIMQIVKGMPVAVAAGEITSVGSILKGTGQYGDWTLQPATLKDSTGEISVTFGNTREIKKGEHITIRSTEGKQGWHGITMDSYKDKPQLKITKTAQINNWTPDTTPNDPETPKIAPTEPKYAPVEQPKATNWDAKERRTLRAMCISYSKDLAISGKIDVSVIENMATSMVDYIYEKEKEILF